MLLAILTISLVGCTSVGAPPAGEAPTATASAAAPGDGGAAPPARPAPTPLRSVPVLGRFDAEEALEVARELAALGPRPGGSAGEDAARRRFAAALRAAGWQVAIEPFPLPQGGTSANVVAWRGARPTGRHAVVGGHLDTVAGSPGANDNASGIGVLVAVAREVADEPLGTPVVVVGFGAEEYQPSTPREHHLGSEAYAAAHADDVAAALIVDMVGNGEPTCICWYDAGPAALAEELRALAPSEGYEVREVGDISDHGPFALRGVPAAFLWTGRDAHYHSPTDTAEHLDVEDLRRAGDLVLTWLRALPTATTSR